MHNSASIQIMKHAFWISFALLVYIYLGYPLLLWVLGKFFSKPVRKKAIFPMVSVVVVVHNEESFIRDKIENILMFDYPKEKLEVVIGSDASTDNTHKIAKEYSYRQIKLSVLKRRMGKVNVLNHIVPHLNGEIVVFCDARQLFEKNALRELVANFADTSIGCVSGDLLYERKGSVYTEQGVGFYWRYETFMRRKEGAIHSVVGATGPIYAIRKRLFVPPYNNTILDDVFIPLMVIKQGYRSIFDPKARAHDYSATNSNDEFRRKVRTIGGNFQLFFQCGSSLNPFISKIAWQLFSHKFLRAFSPIFLTALLFCNFSLLKTPFYMLFFFLQVIFYASAILGACMEKLHVRLRLFSIPYIFCLLNIAALVGFWLFARGKLEVAWKKI